MERQLIEFIEKFFKNLGAKIVLQGDFLFISEVPESFEKFYGKKSPYKFVFSKEKQSEDSELIEKGSYIMKSISNYLESSGQTTLLKINFSIDAENEIKKLVKFSNSKIDKLFRKKRYNFFFRFTFHTTFQYLNEKEKIINDIYVHNGKIVNGNLSNYEIEEGKKEDVRIPDIKEPYFTAKEELKEKIKTKTDYLANQLNNRFEKEKERIEKHFAKENQEFSDILKKAQERLIDLEAEKDYEKIEKQNKILQGIKLKISESELEKDKERAIQIEKQKHGLNINNKLFNTTLIYYPLCIFDCTLKNSYTKRVIEISFDPLTNTVNDLFCESCETKTNELFLCRTGHIACRNCFGLCESCGKEYCKKCLKIVCDKCNKKICKDCSVKCFKCGRRVCVTHTKHDKISGRTFCNDCLKRCERCSELKDPYSFRRSPRTGVSICEVCFRKEMQKRALDGVFED